MLVYHVVQLREDRLRFVNQLFHKRIRDGRESVLTDPFLFVVDFEVESGYIWGADAMPLMPVVLCYQIDWWAVSLLLAKETGRKRILQFCKRATVSVEQRMQRGWGRFQDISIALQYTGLMAINIHMSTL